MACFAAEYFGVAIGLLACCTCMTVLVLYLHHRGSFGYRVPNWVRIVILQGLGRILCMRETIEENLSASGQKVSAIFKYDIQRYSVTQALAEKSDI